MYIIPKFLTKHIYIMNKYKQKVAKLRGRILEKIRTKNYEQKSS